MTPETRAKLATQLLDNELYKTLFNEQEQNAVELMIYATTDEQRASAAMRVQAIRNLKSDCEASLRSTRSRKSAPA